MWCFIEKWPYLREKKLVKLSLLNFYYAWHHPFKLMWWSDDIIHLERPLTIAGMAILQETPVVA